MKSRAGQRQGEEKSRREKMIKEKESEERRCRCAKSAKHCVFPMICGSGGSKSRLAKAAGAEPSGQMRDEKVHAAVARSTFRSQNAQNTPGPDHFWKLRCRKSARRWGAKHISKSKCTNHTSVGHCRATFGSWDVEKVHAVVAQQREAHFKVKMYNKRKGLCTLSKVSKTWGSRICKDAFSVAGAVQKTCSWEMLGGQGADFLRGLAFWSIRSVGLVRWFRVTCAALRMTWHQFFVAGAIL